MRRHRTCSAIIFFMYTAQVSLRIFGRYIRAGSSKNCMSSVSFMLHLGAPIDSGDSENECPLVQAADNGDLSLVQLLLDFGANPRIKSSLALYYAIDFKHIPVVLLLLECSPDLVDDAFVHTISNEDYSTAVMLSDKVSEDGKRRGFQVGVYSGRSQRIVQFPFARL